jgi:hypothetical protein
VPTAQEELHELDQRWARAEIEADVSTLESLALDDFTLVGPAGFVLSKEKWLDRYGQHLSLIGGPPPFAGRGQ